MGTSRQELVDIVDDADTVIATMTRAAARAQNLLHRSVAIAVLSSDERLLVHRRSPDKDVWPGRWDLCAGGVVAAGEDYGAAAVRELAEELGVQVSGPGEVAAIGAGRFEDDEVRSLWRAYLVHHDGPFRFTDGEIVEARFVTRAELVDLARTAIFVPDSAAMVPVFVPGFSGISFRITPDGAHGEGGGPAGPTGGTSTP